MEWLIVSQVLMWVVVVALALTCLALARQVGVLHERIAPAGALAINQALKPGDAAPELRLETLDGEAVTIGGARDRAQLLFFVAPDCPMCKTLLPVIKSVARAERRETDIILASDGEADEHRRYRARAGLEGLPYVLSERLGRSYGVAKLPYAALIGEDGRIAALGLVNSREHLESLLEAKAQGVASLQDYLDRREAAANATEKRISA